MKTDKKSITSLGLDLSLTGTGLVILEDGKIVQQHLIKSKPVGDKPIDELNRILKIVYEIRNHLTGTMIHISVIENLAFGVKNATSLTQLAALNYFVRNMLTHECGYQIPFVLVSPPSLKKFITGSGNAKKDVMLIETFKRYGVTILDDNECDAYGLAQVGLALLDGNSKSTTKLQDEVLTLLKKQI
jgi:crossover junction endodeoxyribonuclease RuvC